MSSFQARSFAEDEFLTSLKADRVVPHPRISGLYIVSTNSRSNNTHRAGQDFIATKVILRNQAKSSSSSFTKEQVNENAIALELLTIATQGQLAASPGGDDSNENNNYCNSEKQVLLRSWNPFRSCVAAAIVGGLEFLPGFKNNNNNNNGGVDSGTRIIYIGARPSATLIHLAEMLASPSSLSSKSSFVLPILLPDFDESVNSVNPKTKAKNTIAEFQMIRSTKNPDCWDDDWFESHSDMESNKKVLEVDTDDFCDFISSPSTGYSSLILTPIIVSNLGNDNKSTSKKIPSFFSAGGMHSKISEALQQYQRTDIEKDNSSSSTIDALIVELLPSNSENETGKDIIENLIKPIGEMYLKQNGEGSLLVLVDGKSPDGNLRPEVVFANAVTALRNAGFKPREQITLEPFEKDKAIIVCVTKN